MKVLVVGSGGREHAIVMKLSQSPSITKIYAAPGNGGISKLAQCVSIKATDIEGMVAFAKQEGIEFAVVAPDDPLVLGMVDAFEQEGIATFGPNKAAAILEGSKVYSKNLMKKYGIPTAAYEVFDCADAAISYIEQRGEYPVVVKADGLALGKGVVIATDFNQAKEAVHSIMTDKIFGDSGSQVVIEEFLTGPEVSVLAFTDSKTIVPMVSAMDHKRAYDGNKGPNTGGMGTIAPNPHYTDALAKECMETIFLPTIEAMNQEGRPFKGCLFFGLMMTPKGPKVIEYNCRFGDPETQVVLSLLDSDLFEIFQAVYQGRLGELNITWKQGSAACVVMASGGYPKSYESGKEINGLNADGGIDSGFVFHAGTKCEGDKLYTSGGRVLGVTAVAPDLENALKQAYQLVDQIHFEKAEYRTDIGRY